jgi:glycosyltransferase involved in cell wall biosynthesis
VNAAGEAGRAVFYSGQPNSVGHVYRVENTVAALNACGWEAEWVPLSDSAAHDKVDAADVVVVFRAGLDGNFSEVRRRCTGRGIPLVYDTDDLIFDPDLATIGHIALFDSLGEADRLVWMQRIESYREALAVADHATVSTDPLASAAGRICPSVFVLPNVLSPAMQEWAAEAASRAERLKAAGEVRLIFASGTPTHQRDFQVAAEAVARVLAKNPCATLTILGALDLDGFLALIPLRHRIEIRSRVPLPQLFGELARADINLCPLEHDNLFCEAKSAVRCLAGSAVGLPSVVSPTAPLLAAVDHGRAGLVARDLAGWESALDRLIADSRLRQETGRQAMEFAREFSDFAKWSSQACGLFQKISARSTIGKAKQILNDMPLPFHPVAAGCRRSHIKRLTEVKEHESRTGRQELPTGIYKEGA